MRIDPAQSAEAGLSEARARISAVKKVTQAIGATVEVEEATRQFLGAAFVA